MALAEIWAAIQRVTSDPRDRQTLLYATAAETGATPATNPDGGAMGYYQILPGQGVSDAQAYDPLQSTQIFFSRWGVHQCALEQGGLWTTNPDEAANAAAICAERGGAYNAGQRATERSLWAKVSASVGGDQWTQSGCAVGNYTCLNAWRVANNVGVDTGFLGPPVSDPTQLGFHIPSPGDIIGGAAGSAVSSALAPIWSIVQSLFSNHTFWVRALLVVGGLAGILIGVKGLSGIDAGSVAGAAAVAA